MPGYLTFVERVVHDERLDERDHGRRLAAHRRLLDDLRRRCSRAGSITLRFRAVLNANLPIGTNVTNTGMVYWNDPQQTASASVSIDVGGIPGVGILNGRRGTTRTSTESPMPRARARRLDRRALSQRHAVVLGGPRMRPVLYRISGVPPNYQHGGAVRAALHRARRRRRTARSSAVPHSPFTNGLQRISDIVVQSGSNLQNLDLPIEPNGVVYNSMSRAPIPGATLTLIQCGQRHALPASCFDDPAQQDQVTLAERLLQVRPQLHRPGVPERRRLSAST